MQFFRELYWRLISRTTRGGVMYWRARASRYGARSVLNIAHDADEYAAVTTKQRETLLPLLERELEREDRVALDFGCGPGRFTPDLARLCGKAIGVDPVEMLLHEAPREENVTYHLLRHGVIPLDDESVDVVWICIVLSMITEPKELARAQFEIVRVLRKGGLLFLAENTSTKRDRRHIRFRSTSTYQQLFAPTVHLEVIGQYEDAGETISILSGRR